MGNEEQQIDTSLEAEKASLNKDIQRLKVELITGGKDSSGRDLFENYGKRRKEAITDEDRESLVKSVTGESREGTYVEVGFGVRPYVLTTDREFTESSRYVGVEGGESEYSRQRNGDAMQQQALYSTNESLASSVHERSPYAQIMFGDGNKLPLPDGSAQEIFMGNVVLSPGMTPEGMLRMFKEAKRVLNPQTGTLVICESDALADIHNPQSFGREAQAKLGIALEHAGFKKRTLIGEDDEACEAIVDTYGRGGGRDTQFAIAQPVERSSETMQPPAKAKEKRWSRFLKR
jgi:hypothetical protein